MSAVASGGASRKQLTLTPFDRDAVALARERLGLDRATVLHPSVMYRRFRPAWSKRVSAKGVIKELSFAPLARPTPVAGLDLPPRYVAMKPYASGVLPAAVAGRRCSLA